MEEEGEVDGGHQRLQQQRRSLASILSIGSGTSKTAGGTASKIRPKTPSVVITDESTVLVFIIGYYSLLDVYNPSFKTVYYTTGSIHIIREN